MPGQMEMTKLSTKGQIVLPLRIRNSRAWNTGMEFTVEEMGDGILLRPQDILQTDPAKLVVVASGTQGEPMSALSRIAVDNHKNISVERGDTVVLSARIIPGNEKGIYRMINHFAKRGAEVIYGSMNPPIHVSGHGSAE